MRFPNSPPLQAVDGLPTHVQLWDTVKQGDVATTHPIGHIPTVWRKLFGSRGSLTS